MIRFVLNDTLIQTANPPGLPLLDFIRTEMGLKGTKSGCREGDCGACMVMAGELTGNRVIYKTVVSCLTPLGNAHGKHIVTIEGIQVDGLSPVQEAILGHSATQCGFCTPGFVISLTAHSLSDNAADPDRIQACFDGNICRCTGYKSIERAAETICAINRRRDGNEAVAWMAGNGYLPGYFLTIPGRLAEISRSGREASGAARIVAGGTDLMVQRADELLNNDLLLTADQTDLRMIEAKEGICTIGASVTAGEIMDSGILRACIPSLEKYFKLISSSPIRNMGTLAGNIVNASPIADLVIFFLALDATVLLAGSGDEKRTVLMKEFFTGYKRLKKQEDENIRSISFRLPEPSDFFNFEKVSKRQHLDIASVNSAIYIRLNNNRIETIHLSAGGVSPVPLYLAATAAFLTGKTINRVTLSDANTIMQEEISPISDIRGSERYKRLLLRQLFYAHFFSLFPGETGLAGLVVKNTGK